MVLYLKGFVVDFCTAPAELAQGHGGILSVHHHYVCTASGRNHLSDT